MSGAGALTLNSGGLILADTTTTGSITGGVLKGSASSQLAINVLSSNFSIGSVIADNGAATALVKTGSGTLTLTGSNETYTGNTYLNQGTLAFSLSSSLNYSHTISGSGGLTVAGNLLMLTGSNTYTGPTTISGGTLQLGNGTAGFDGSLASGSISNNGALIFDFNGSKTYFGVISGTGSTTISGGTLVLANSGTMSNETVAIGSTAGIGFDSSVLGNSFTFGGLSGSGTVSLLNNAGSAIALTVGTNSVNTTYSGAEWSRLAHEGRQRRVDLGRLQQYLHWRHHGLGRNARNNERLRAPQQGRSDHWQPNVGGVERSSRGAFWEWCVE